MTMTVVEHGVDSASVQTVNMISSVPHQWSPHWHHTGTRPHLSKYLDYQPCQYLATGELETE